MSDDRIIGIPDDIVHETPVYSATSELPTLWNHVYHQIAELHQKFRDELGQEPGETETIGVIDTGYNSHDLLPEPVAGRSFVGEQWNRARNNHGNHCAGIALGRGVGVAPGAKLIVGQVLGSSGSGSTRGINAGREWCAKQGATIISESLGDGGGPPIQEDLESYDRTYGTGNTVICVTAAGNASRPGRPGRVGRPGSYSPNYNLAVGALKQQNGNIEKAEYTSKGETVFMSWAGSNIVSCGVRSPDELVTMSGTSMATPGVAGMMSLENHWMKAVGIRVPQGPKERAKYYLDNDLFNDEHTPGKDGYTGHGSVSWPKVFAKMLNTKWVSILIAIGLFHLLTSACQAQQAAKIDIQPVEFISVPSDAQVFENTDGTKLIISKAAKKKFGAIVSIKDEQPPKYVNAFKRGKWEDSFPPQQIEPLMSGLFVIEGNPGDEFALQLVFENRDTWRVVKIPGSDNPFNPDEPSEPGDLPYSELKDSVASSKPPKPSECKRLAGVWESTLETQADSSVLNDVRQAMSRARIKLFTSSDFDSSGFNPVLVEIESWFSDFEDKVGVAEYRKAMGKVIEGLK